MSEKAQNRFKIDKTVILYKKHPDKKKEIPINFLIKIPFNDYRSSETNRVSCLIYLTESLEESLCRLSK